MTFQLTSLHRGTLDLSRPLHSGAKHRLDYAELVRKVEGDLVGAIACASVAANVLDADDDRWHSEWFAAGEAALARAVQAVKKANDVEARNHWRRASVYFGAAELYLSYDDPRQPLTVAKLKAACRDYIRSLQAGSVIQISGPSGVSHEAYLVRNVDPDAPFVICIGGWDDTKESLVPLIEPALASGLSVLVVDAPPPNPAAGRGHKRFQMTAFLIGCIDYLEEVGNIDAAPTALYGVGAGISFASELAAFDDRVRAVAGDFASVDGLRMSAVVRTFIGSDRFPPIPEEAADNAGDSGHFIDTRPDMPAADIFGRIARQMASDRN